MKIKKLVIGFCTVFAVSLATAALVTFLWNLIGHAASAVDWENSFRFAVIFGIILTWAKSWESKEGNMKRLLIFTIMLALTACTAPQAGMPNPASVYCTQQGNKLEIHTAADGGQNGICIFLDGGTCDEWAYYRGECGPATPAVIVEATANPSNDPGSFVSPGTAEAITNWWGVIKRTEPGAQYDDYFERQDLGQSLYFGIDSMDPAVKSQIEALRDSGRIVHLYGSLLSNVPDYNGSQIQVDHIEVEE